MALLLNVFAAYFFLFPVIEGFQKPEVAVGINITTTAEGSDVVLLNCSATGTPIPSLYWLRLDEALLNTSFSHTAAEGEGVLLLQNFSSPAGWYVCVAVNSVGLDVSDITKLNNSGVMLNISTDQSIEVLQYNSVTIPCCIGGVIPREHYWMNTEGNLSSSTQTLVLSEVKLDDGGIYICISGTEQSIAIRSVRVTVQEVCKYSVINRERAEGNNDIMDYAILMNTTFDADSENITRVTNSILTVPQSHTAVLDCSCSLNERQALFFLWDKLNSNSLPEKVAGHNTSILIIPNVSHTDSGTYQCASGTSSNVSLTHINLTIIELPTTEVLPTRASIISITLPYSLLNINDEFLEKFGIGLASGLTALIVVLLGGIILLYFCFKKGIFGSSYPKYTGIESESLWDIITCKRNKKSLLGYAIQVQRPDRVDVQGTANMISVRQFTSSEWYCMEKEEEEEEDSVLSTDDMLNDSKITWNVHRPFDENLVLT